MQRPAKLSRLVGCWCNPAKPGWQPEFMSLLAGCVCRPRSWQFHAGTFGCPEPTLMPAAAQQKGQRSMTHLKAGMKRASTAGSARRVVIASPASNQAADAAHLHGVAGLGRLHVPAGQLAAACPKLSSFVGSMTSGANLTSLFGADTQSVRHCMTWLACAQ